MYLSETRGYYFQTRVLFLGEKGIADEGYLLVYCIDSDRLWLFGKKERFFVRLRLIRFGADVVTYCIVIY